MNDMGAGCTQCACISTKVSPIFSLSKTSLATVARVLLMMVRTLRHGALFHNVLFVQAKYPHEKKLHNLNDGEQREPEEQAEVAANA